MRLWVFVAVGCAVESPLGVDASDAGVDVGVVVLGRSSGVGSISAAGRC